MRNSLTAIFTLLVSFCCSGQDVISPEIHSDNSVTFRYYAPQSKKVNIVADFQFEGEDTLQYTDINRKWRMTKDSMGVWSITTPPIIPETYTYAFETKGKIFRDNGNPEIVWQNDQTFSLISIKGNKNSDIYLNHIIKGRIDTIFYYSEIERFYRRALVYLPLEYHKNNESFPVLYLLHGLNGSETAWTARGRVLQIVENLASQGIITPIIIFIPDCNVGKRAQEEKHYSLLSNMLNYPALCQGKVEDAFPQLVCYIDSAYRPSALPQDNAIAGFSSGARMTANIIINNPQRFANVGIFSPVIHKEQVPDEKRMAIDSLVSTYHIYLGKNDFFYGNGEDFYKRLDKKNIPYIAYSYYGGHTWRAWRLFLADFIKTAFPAKE